MESGALATINPVELGERLADARRARGLTQLQAAEEIGVARTTLTAIEKGIRRPRAMELVTLARLYGRRVGELVAAPARQGPGFVAQFRAARNWAETHEAAQSEDARRFEQWCRWYVELEEIAGSPLPQRYPTPYDISGTPPVEAGEEVAAAERNRLGLGEGPLGDLWSLLETDVGLRIFAMPMRDRGVSGMFVYDPEFGGCIAVSLEHPEERRRWTVAHEYAHFLTNRQRAEVTTTKPIRRPDDQERFAAAFDAAFLMPGPALAGRFRAITRAKPDGGATPADVLGLCHLYGVSFAAMMLRLEKLRLLPTGAYDKLTSLGFEPDTARTLFDLPKNGREARKFPARYERLAALAYRSGNLSEGQLARLLDTDRITALLRVDEIALEQEPGEAGEIRHLRLDLGANLVASR
jgi:Zn-dependent peptidase ImmA (M78 family)/transcriptional regulator with XRE-family HTH domain